MTKYRRGKGKGKGYHSMFLTENDQLTYLRAKGKTHRAHTSGKGHGRKGNPFGKNGEKMKCHQCGSTEHLLRDCPNRNGASAHPQPDRQDFMCSSLVEIPIHFSQLLLMQQHSPRKALM